MCTLYNRVGWLFDDLGFNVPPTAKVICRREEKYVFHCKPEFYYINVGYKGVINTWTYFPDDWKGEHVKELKQLYLQSKPDTRWERNRNTSPEI